MRAVYISILVITLFSTIQAKASITPSATLGKKFSELVTQSLNVSYNYLKISSKFGTKDAYPGFWSLFVKLSDDITSKAHDLVKFVALRRFEMARLIGENGLQIQKKTRDLPFNLRDDLKEARHQNQDLLRIIEDCHAEGGNTNDANAQDYLESHLFEHHIEVDKLFSDIENRLGAAKEGMERNLVQHMIDEELLQTYGDRRKNIFS